MLQTSKKQKNKYTYQKRDPFNHSTNETPGGVGQYEDNRQCLEFYRH